MRGLLSVKVPDIQVTLGSPSSSGAVNMKAVIAVPILLYLSSVCLWFLASGVASFLLPVDCLMLCHPFLVLLNVSSLLLSASLFALLLLCSPACLLWWGYAGPYIGCFAAQHFGMTSSLELVICKFHSMGWHHSSVGWHHLLSLWLAGLRAWPWLGDYFFVVWDRLIAISVSVSLHWLIKGLCLTWPVDHRAMSHSSTHFRMASCREKATDG